MNPPTPSEPVIRMEQVSAGSLRGGTVAVIENIDWTVQAGEFWVVAGLHGAGKTDFLMLTAGLLAPQRGRYWLLGDEMPIFEEARLDQRLNVGLVFDGGGLIHHLTVRENIALPLRYHLNLTPGQADSEVAGWLEAMELAPWADITPGALGRNWRKRVGLARALILQPEVLLVDNPLLGLDPRHAHWWRDWLDQLSRGHALLRHRPLTLIVTTAELRPWKSQTSRFAILRDRRLEVIGTWAQLEAANPDRLRELLLAPPGAGGSENV